MSVPIRDAATILPLRDRDGGIEVFMVKRNSRMGFLGGAHVFPGGAVDKADVSPEMCARLGGFCAGDAACLLALDDAERALGYVVAGIRELYEEAGVLLARDANGKWIDLETDAPVANTLRAARPQVAAGKLSFASVLAEADATVDAGCIGYFAHWITPRGEKKRFDTRFFLAACPPRQSADHDRRESVEGGWIAPDEALRRYGAREIELVPPTIVSLDRLTLAASAAEAIEAATALEVEEILPKISMSDGKVAILYPGDPDYDGGEAHFEESGRVLKRLVLRDGLWEAP